MIAFPSGYIRYNDDTIDRLQQQSIIKDYRVMCPIVLVALILGFRYNYAFDWEQNWLIFEYAQRNSLYRENVETGYFLVNRLLAQLGLNGYSIFIVQGFLWNFALALLMNNFRKGLVFGWVFSFLLMRFDILNLSRQFMAISVLYIGFAYLLKERRLLYFAFAFAACSIHATAWLYVIPFFLVPYLSNKIDKINVNAILIVYAILLFVSETIMPYLFNSAGFLIEYYFDSKSAYLNNDYMQDDIFVRQNRTAFRIALSAIKDISLVFWIKYLWKDIFANKTIRVLFILAVCSMYANSIMGSNELTSRFCYYLTTFYGLSWGIVAVFYIKRQHYPLHLHFGFWFMTLHTLYMNIASISYEFHEFHTWLMYKGIL